MIFNVYEIVAYLSTDTTLYPGTVILTGTPGGVGMAQNKWMKAGDTIEVTLEKVGSLRNTLENAPKERASKVPWVANSKTSLVSKL